MTFLPAQAVANATADVGYHEGPNNANKFSLWQYGDYHEPWCASAISKWTYDAGFRWWVDCVYGEKGDNNVGQLRIHAAANNLWRPDPSYLALPGDVITFTFTEADQHTELVATDAGPDYEHRTGRPRYLTIGGNTSDQVAWRSRWERNRIGIVALTSSPQVDPSVPPLSPKEIILMGTTAMCTIPGAKVQTKGPFKGRLPELAAVLQPNGETHIVGAYGATLIGGVPGGFGTSVLNLGRLNAPIRELEPDVSASGRYLGTVTGCAEDFGHFTVRPKVVTG